MNELTGKCVICGKECKAECCSGACRARLSRQKAHVKRTRTIAHASGRTAALQDYQDNPDDYYPRFEPEKMNWGPWLSADQLAQSEYKCNRVLILGDWDYVGCVTPERIAASLRI